jgi:hypothetical protein
VDAKNGESRSELAKAFPFGTDDPGVSAVSRGGLLSRRSNSMIDERYGKWAVRESVNSPLKIWCVEPEKLRFN